MITEIREWFIVEIYERYFYEEYTKAQFSGG